MKTITFFRWGLATMLLLPALSLLAQNNYVANTPNAATPASGNTLVDPAAGNNTMTGTENSFFGHNSGVSNTSGSQNTFLGILSGAANTTGALNRAIALK